MTKKNRREELTSRPICRSREVEALNQLWQRKGARSAGLAGGAVRGLPGFREDAVPRGPVIGHLALLLRVRAGVQTHRRPEDGPELHQH